MFVFLAGCTAQPVIDGDSMPLPLGGIEGDPVAGEQIFVARESGHCVLCHQVNGLSAPFQGNLGPSLSDVGARLSPGQIRLRLVDASLVNPGTVMPPYHRTNDLNQVDAAYTGKPVLTEAEIEHLVAYLAGLRMSSP